MEFKSILDSVSKLRQDLQEKRKVRNLSRSNSPKENIISNSFESADDNSLNTSTSFKPTAEVPITREELVEKYSTWKCPLPRPRTRPKTYKLDAVELIASSIQKIIKNYFAIIKQKEARTRVMAKKPPIFKTGRGRSISDLERHGNSTAEVSKMNITQIVHRRSESKERDKDKDKGKEKEKEKEKYKIFAKIAGRVARVLVIRKIKPVFLVIRSIQRKDHRYLGLVSCQKLLKLALRAVLNLIIRASAARLDLSKLIGSPSVYNFRYLTPKPFENIKSSKIGEIARPVVPEIHMPKIINSLTPRLEPSLTPGRIIRNLSKIPIDGTENSSKSIRESNDPDRNPTFGPETEESPKFSLEEIQFQSEMRNLEIRRKIDQLERSNSLHQKQLEKSRKHSLSSMNSSFRKSFIDNSTVSINTDMSMQFHDSIIAKDTVKEAVFKSEISPIKLQHKYQLSEASNYIDEVWKNTHGEMEELSLKSFNKYPYNSSFEKESTIVKNSKEESDSFDLRFGSSNPGESGKINNRYFCEKAVSSPVNAGEDLMATGNFARNNKGEGVGSNAKYQRRKEFLRRLDVLGKLEERFCLRVQDEFGVLVERMKLCVLDKILSLIRGVLKRRFEEVVGSIKNVVKEKCLTSMVRVLTGYLLGLRGKILRKWRARAKRIRVKINARRNAVRDIGKVIGEKRARDIADGMLGIKNTAKNRRIREISISFGHRILDCLLQKIMEARKLKAFLSILRFSSITRSNLKSNTLREILEKTTTENTIYRFFLIWQQKLKQKQNIRELLTSIVSKLSDRLTLSKKKAISCLKSACTFYSEKKKGFYKIVNIMSLISIERIHQAIIKWKFSTKIARNRQYFILNKLKKFSLLGDKYSLKHFRDFIVLLKRNVSIQKNATVSFYLTFRTIQKNLKNYAFKLLLIRKSDRKLSSSSGSNYNSSKIHNQCAKKILRYVDKHLSGILLEAMSRWLKFNSSQTLIISKKYQKFIENISAVLHTKLCVLLNAITKSKAINLANICEKVLSHYCLQNRFNNWKKKFRINFLVTKRLVTVQNLVEIVKMKYFPILWNSWKCMKNSRKPEKIRNKILLRKAIENWEKVVYSKADMWIEAFYHWRGLSKLEKMYKLKGYKQFFT